MVYLYSLHAPLCGERTCFCWPAPVRPLGIWVWTRSAMMERRLRAERGKEKERKGECIYSVRCTNSPVYSVTGAEKIREQGQNEQMMVSPIRNMGSLWTGDCQVRMFVAGHLQHKEELCGCGQGPQLFDNVGNGTWYSSTKRDAK